MASHTCALSTEMCTPRGMGHQKDQGEHFTRQVASRLGTGEGMGQSILGEWGGLLLAQRR